MSLTFCSFTFKSGSGKIFRIDEADVSFVLPSSWVFKEPFGLEVNSFSLPETF